MTSIRNIHSGHFMVSSLNEDEDSVDLSGQINESTNSRPPPAAAGYNFENANRQLPSNIFFGNKSLEKLALDPNLTKMFHCMTLAYSGKLVSPRWKNFKGIKVKLKDKIRLNNIIWREWYMQFRQKKEPVICQFDVPVSDRTHARPEAVVMEGKYWKRRLDNVTTEYMKWRMFFKENMMKTNFKKDPPTNNELLDRLLSDNSRICLPHVSSELSSYLVEDEFPMDFASDSLFAVHNQPLAFPDPREIWHLGFSDFVMQPGLIQLQPAIDDCMDTNDSYCTSEEIADMMKQSNAYSKPDSNFDQSLFGQWPFSVGSSAPPPVQRPKAAVNQARNVQTGSPGNVAAAFHERFEPLPPDLVNIADVLMDDGNSLEAEIGTMLCSNNVDIDYLIAGSDKTPPTPPQPRQRPYMVENSQVLWNCQPVPVPSQASNSVNAVPELPFPDSTQNASQVGKVGYGCYVQNAPNPHPGSVRNQIGSFSSQPSWNSVFVFGEGSDNSNCSEVDRNAVLYADPVRKFSSVSQPSSDVYAQEASAGLGEWSAQKSPASRTARHPQVSWDPVLEYDMVSDGRAFNSRRQQSQTVQSPFSGSQQQQQQQQCAALYDVEAYDQGQRKDAVQILSGRTVGTSSLGSKTGQTLAGADARRLLQQQQQSAAGGLVPNSPDGSRVVSMRTLQEKTVSEMVPCAPYGQRPTKATAEPAARAAKSQDAHRKPTSPASANVTSTVAARTVQKPDRDPVSTSAAAAGCDQSAGLRSPTAAAAVFEAGVHHPSVYMSGHWPGNRSEGGGGGNSSRRTHDGTKSPAYRSATNSPEARASSSPGLSSARRLSTGSGAMQRSPGSSLQVVVKSEPPNEDARSSHVSTEYKRRCNIKNGFDALNRLVPSLSDVTSVKINKATTLKKAAEFCNRLKSDHELMLKECANVRSQIEKLQSEISWYQSQLPAGGSPGLGRKKLPQCSYMLTLYEAYVLKQSEIDWKFWIFSLIIRSLFESYSSSVGSARTPDELNSSVNSWLRTHVSLVELRQVALDSMRHLILSTSILTEPAQLQQQVVDIVGQKLNNENSAKPD